MSRLKSIDLRMTAFAIGLIVAGIFLMQFLSKYDLAKGIGEALIVAGVLSFGIDPILKQNLMKEATKGIFIHFLGFEHHPQVKDKIKDIIFETKVLRGSFDIRCWIEPEADFWWFTAEYESQLINPTNNPVSYQPWAEWDAAHQVQVQHMSVTSSDGKCNWIEKNVPVKETSPGIHEVKGKKFEIQPSSKNVTYATNTRYRIKTRMGYCQFHMGRPTLRASIRVMNPLPDYQIEATGADVRNESYWQYNKILMRGDHLTLRWRRCGEEWL